MHHQKRTGKSQQHKSQLDGLDNMRGQPVQPSQGRAEHMYPKIRESGLDFVDVSAGLAAPSGFTLWPGAWFSPRIWILFLPDHDSSGRGGSGETQKLQKSGVGTISFSPATKG
jgi:hypothetical protein